MAFNVQTFKTRALTAVVFAAVMLAGLLWNYWSFFILFSVIHFGCWWEYLKLTEKIYSTTIDVVIKYFLMITGFILFLIVGTPHLIVDFTIESLSIKWLFYFLLLFCIAAFLFQNKKIEEQAKWMAFAGMVYISLSLGLMLYTGGSGFVNAETGMLKGQTSYTDLSHWHSFGVTIFTLSYLYPCTTIFSIWINDTMAYVVGSFIGKTPFSKISPKKTWEGTIGGALLCIVVISLIAHYTGLLNVQHAALIAAICAVFGTLGDLLESKLKRMAGVKDSGSIMPGHGGFLDRFDSLLVATPFVWLYVYFVL